jgi:putative membrane protein
MNALAVDRRRAAAAGPTAGGGPPRRIAIAVYSALGLGAALFVALVVWRGAREVLAVLAVAGWQLIWLAAYHLVAIGVDALGWRSLFPRPVPPFARIAVARWIAEGVNNLLPVAQLGGEVARARAVRGPGVPARIAGATVVVDITVSALTQLLFTLTGVALLLWYFGRQRFVPYVLLGVVLFGALVALFYRWQRRGMFGFAARRLSAALGGRRWAMGNADAVDAAIAEVYERPAAVLLAGAFNFASWVLGAGEVWIAMRLFGHPVSVLDAFLLESLGQAVRQAAFLIPAGLGVQEGGFVVLGAALGIDPESALALSLAKRVRELVLGLPSLLAWQWVEGAHFVRGMPSANG